MARASGTIYLSRDTPELMRQGCSGLLECVMAGVGDTVVLLLWFAILLIAAVTSLVFLPKARSLCDAERHRVQAEYDAFEEFADRLRSFSTANTDTVTKSATGGQLVHQQVAQSGDGLEKVREAYRETIMSVPHFEEDYDEGLQEHMTVEFGNEYAQAVTSASTFGPQLKQQLLAAAIDARDRREEFLKILEDEAAALEAESNILARLTERLDATTRSRCADATYQELQERHQQLEQFERQLDELIDRRQAERFEGRAGSLQYSNASELQEYLYQSLDVEYPVIAEIARLSSQLKVGYRRIEDELIYRS